MTIPPDPQPGVLLVADIHASPEEAIAIVLDYPARSLILATMTGESNRARTNENSQRTPPAAPGDDGGETLRPVSFLGLPSDSFSGGTIESGVDPFLEQFRHILLAAGTTLDRATTAPQAHNECVRAREILQDLANWAIQAQIFRSGQDARVLLKVPNGVAEIAIELGRIGRRLVYHGQMVDTTGVGKVADPDPGSAGLPSQSSAQRFTAAALNGADKAVLIVLERARRETPPQARSADEIRRRAKEAGLDVFRDADHARRAVYSLRDRKWPIPNALNGTGYRLDLPLLELCPDLAGVLEAPPPTRDQSTTN